VKQQQWGLLLTLVVVAFVLSGCGVSYGGVDITSTPPEGWWQTLVVWPLGKALIWLDSLLQQGDVPYHWGFAIILFTIIVKVVTFPLSLVQIRGMQAQKELQPKIQELQKKYGKDRERLSQEQMKLYQEAGVNPLSGCLPLIIQMPVLFGLYAALVALGPSLQNASWFWIPDLGFPKYTQGMNWIPELFQAGDYGRLAAYLILPILLMASQFVMQKWMTPSTPDSDSQTGNMMKQLSWMMTFMFGFFTLQVPAGLTLYWVVSNLLQMLQQWVITSERFGFAGASSASTPFTTTSKAAAGMTKQVVSPSPSPVSANGERLEAKPTQVKQLKRRRAKRK
jgi:YidC/Oxa1 family membrane protein insertase